MDTDTQFGVMIKECQIKGAVVLSFLSERGLYSNQMYQAEGNYRPMDVNIINRKRIDPSNQVIIPPLKESVLSEEESHHFTAVTPISPGDSQADS